MVIDCLQDSWQNDAFTLQHSFQVILIVSFTFRVIRRCSGSRCLFLWPRRLFIMFWRHFSSGVFVIIRIVIPVVQRGTLAFSTLLLYFDNFARFQNNVGGSHMTQCLLSLLHYDILSRNTTPPTQFQNHNRILSGTWPSAQPMRAVVISSFPCRPITLDLSWWMWGNIKMADIGGRLKIIYNGSYRCILPNVFVAIQIIQTVDIYYITWKFMTFLLVADVLLNWVWQCQCSLTGPGWDRDFFYCCSIYFEQFFPQGASKNK